MAEASSVPADLLCPICHDVMSSPMCYPDCGHALCRDCMRRADAQNRDAAAPHTLPIYQCPVCRQGTVVPWPRRPRAIALESLCQEHRAGADPADEGADDDVMQAADDELQWILGMLESPNSNAEPSIHLGRLAQAARTRRAEEYVATLLQPLCEAALQGCSFVQVTNNCKNLHVVCDEIALRLFRYGVHSVRATPSEFTVYFTPQSTTWVSTHINDNYNAAPIALPNVPSR